MEFKVQPGLYSKALSNEEHTRTGEGKEEGKGREGKERKGLRKVIAF